MKYHFYNHAGSGNHGCEAIVRGSAEILGNGIILHSSAPEQDEKYGVAEAIESLILDKNEEVKPYSLPWIKAALQTKFTGSINEIIYYRKKDLIDSAQKGDVWFSIGGDIYCYSGFESYCALNFLLRRKGIKNVLWGCSIEKSLIDETLKKDLCGYDLIVARESITYDCLKKIGAKVILCADPAFQMKSRKCDTFFDKTKGKVIGINISPMIMSCETGDGAAYQNYSELIRYILDNTDYQIAFIPHVVWASNDDRNVNKKLYEDFGKNERITVIEDHGAEELKYIISQCDMFIGARTHSTIAAYSTCVPTLVVGYSVKAKGIAKDIFGTYENYVLPVQSLKEKDDLTNAFKWLENHEYEIRAHLNEFIPGYCEQGMKAGEEIKKLTE